MEKGSDLIEHASSPVSWSTPPLTEPTLNVLPIFNVPAPERTSGKKKKKGRADASFSGRSPKNGCHDDVSGSLTIKLLGEDIRLGDKCNIPVGYYLK